MTIGVSIVHFVIKVPTLVQMIVAIYRVQAYQVPIVNPRWLPKSKMAATNFFVDISTSDRGDFSEMALFQVWLHIRCMFVLQICWLLFRNFGMTDLNLKIGWNCLIQYWFRVCLNSFPQLVHTWSSLNKIIIFFF